MGGGGAGRGGGGGGEVEGVDKASLDAGDGKLLFGLFLLSGGAFAFWGETLLLILYFHLTECDWITMREENIGIKWNGNLVKGEGVEDGTQRGPLLVFFPVKETWENAGRGKGKKNPCRAGKKHQESTSAVRLHVVEWREVVFFSQKKQQLGVKRGKKESKQSKYPFCVIRFAFCPFCFYISYSCAREGLRGGGGGGILS